MEFPSIISYLTEAVKAQDKTIWKQLAINELLLQDIEDLKERVSKLEAKKKWFSIF